MDAAISDAERQQIIAVLEQEVARLESLTREYRGARKPTNVVIKAMADEGAAGMDERIKRTKALVARLRGPQAQERR